MTPIHFGLGIKFAWMKAPDLEFHNWTQAAQRLWLWLKKPNHGDQTRFRFTDRQLAKILGVGHRCVQYALRWLEQHGIIQRFMVYGPRDVAGRVIEITIELATREPARTAKPASPPPAPQGTPTPPTVIPKPDPEPEPTDEDLQAAREEWKKFFLPDRPAAATGPRPDQRARQRQHQEPTREGQRLRRKLDETHARLEQARDLNGADTDPVLTAEIARLEALQASLRARLDLTTPARE